MKELVIEGRFCGPPGSGNGGYTAGLLAGFIEGPAEVTLRKPPPLNKPLQVAAENSGFRLMDGEALVAEARPVELALEPPQTVGWDEAVQAAERFPGFEFHHFPRCFVCGTDRQEGDGLRIFSGPSGDGVAAPWQPDESLGDETGVVKPEFIWAALDCPGYFAAFVGKAQQRALLGRMTASITGSIRVGDQCVVIGWPEHSQGRKHTVGTAILAPGGGVVALAKGLWITVP
ncbi:hypothetical protein ACXYTJ_15345 [Gilvimarinus sp. F26214L]|uniref:hypothetical protein n=1 Tax=Gilvimarinus sp. DZF01 TaxID=3461371 RepID=UPI0040467B63